MKAGHHAYVDLKATIAARDAEIAAVKAENTRLKPKTMSADDVVLYITVTCLLLCMGIPQWAFAMLRCLICDCSCR